MLDETQGQATDDAVQELPQETVDAAPSIDYAALEQRAGEIVPGASVSTIMDSYGESRRQMGTLQTKYDTVKPLVEGIENNPGLGEALQERAQEFFSEQQAPAQSAAPVTQALDPLSKRLSEVEVQLISTQMNTRLNTVAEQITKKTGLEFTEADKIKVWDRVNAENSSAVEDFAWALKAQDAIQSVTKKVRAETAEKVQKGQAAYNVPEGTAPEQTSSAPTNPTDDQIIDGISEYFR